MKTKILVTLTLLIATVSFSQKTELKAAEKALKGGDAATAKSTLEGISSTIDGAEAKYHAQYYSLLGTAYSKLSEYKLAKTAFDKVISLEESSGKKKYTVDTRQKLNQMTADVVNAAIKDTNDKKYKESADKLYLGYQLSPKDTIYLYYAASGAVNGGDYDNALKYYNELKEVGYDGSETKFTAVNIASGETEEFDKTTRDIYLKAGTHKDPKEVKSPSKKAEIVKNIALIYQQQGKNEEALGAYDDALAVNPEDVNLILNKANLYFELGDKDKFKELMAKASNMAPDNPDLLYNIGVINMEQGNLEEARKAYRKALEVDPSYVNAQLNLSTSYVNEGNGLIDEMNSLGTSRADNARFDELKQKKEDLFIQASKVLEEALVTNPANEGVLTQLKNIYGALGDNENFMRIKKLIGE